MRLNGFAAVTLVTGLSWVATEATSRDSTSVLNQRVIVTITLFLVRTSFGCLPESDTDMAPKRE